ncbi:MAG: hypothetical protein L3K03_09065 [Thermoplasmata archaeon]|nr:hypothetical protein [Thermoplasmata archaeon]
MSSVVRVPPELDAFLRLPPPQSLIIRGPPGSGKTMLSLSLMESFVGRRIYVSLRSSRQSLLDQIPWLGSIPPGEFELINTGPAVDHIQAHASVAHDSGAVLPDRDRDPELEDLLWLPEAVQSAWRLSNPAQPTLIIFDSWDAIIDEYFERGLRPGETLPSRDEIERRLLARMIRAKITLVLVLERDSPSALDYQVNGIIETSRKLEEGRLERWVSLPKLRGVPIETDTYPFSLAHGKFAAITPVGPGLRYRFNPPVPDPQSDHPSLWPGSSDFARHIGRLRFGELTLLEQGPGVPREVSRVLVAPMLIQVLRAGGEALLVAPPSIDPEDAYISLRHHLPTEVLNDRLRVLTSIPPNPAGHAFPDVFVPANRIEWTKTGPAFPVPEGPSFLKRAQSSEHPNLIVIYLSGLQSLADAAGIVPSPGILAGLDAAVFPQSRVHIVVIGRTGDPQLEALGSVVETHIRIRGPHGRVFLNGQRPYLSPLVLSQELGSEPYRLTPVL